MTLTAGIEALVERYGLSAGAGSRLEALARLLIEDPRAATSIRDPAKVIDDHLADSLVALEVEQVRNASVIADLGSGAGVPGLPLAIALPAARVDLLESSARKCAFVERAIAESRTGNARAVNARIEEWSERLGGIELVTARALAPFPVVLEYAAPLLTIGGTAVVWRGRRDPVAETEGAEVAAKLGLELGDVRPVRPYAAATNRNLYLASKVMETPSGFPRRPGMALKRPLWTR